MSIQGKKTSVAPKVSRQPKADIRGSESRLILTFLLTEMQKVDIIYLDSSMETRSINRFSFLGLSLPRSYKLNTPFDLLVRRNDFRVQFYHVND